MNTRRRSTSFSPPVKNSSIVSETQLKVLEKHFERGQFVDANSAEKLSKDLKMPVKQIKAWFTKMRRKSKCFKKTATSDKEMYSIHGSDALYAVKQPRVPVLVDMGTLKAIKNSIESCEIVLDGDDEEDENIRSINDIDENVDISTLNTSTLLKVNASMAEIASQMVIEEDNTPLIKQCTTTNGYIETLLERIEQLEDSIKEKEGEVYFMKKDMDKVQETLDSKEAVLNTIQKSIPKVVSDHKKALQDKDAEILKWKTKSDEIKMELDKLQEKYQVDPEGNGDRTEEVEQLVSTIAEKDRLIEDLRGCNVKQQTDDQQPSSYDLTDLREKVSALETDVSLKADELHVLKFKLRQHENSWRVTRDLEERLESSKQQVAVLQEKNDVSSQKIADLELDVFSKSAEIRSLSDIVTRLNTKLKESNQSNHAMDLSGCAKDESVATEVDHPLDISSRGSEGSSLSFNHSVVEELFSDILNTF